MFIDITNGTNSFKVTKGAYESIFKPQGYTPVVVEVDNSAMVQDGPGVNVERILEKPYSEWTKADITEVAQFYDISLRGTKNMEQGLERVKEFLMNNA